MLILTRRVGESIKIGDDVDITAPGVKRDQVRVGINAPGEVAVHRDEVYERIKREKCLSASEGQPPKLALSFAPPSGSSAS